MLFGKEFIKTRRFVISAPGFVFKALIICLPIVSFGQRENNIWMMGNYQPNLNSGIDFNSGSPDTFSVLRNLDFYLLNASICDTTGMLLFYTNGQYVANRIHDTLLNSVNFNPGYLTNYYSPYGMGLPQGAFVIPRPDHYGQYYLFHESGELVSVSGRVASQPVKLSCSLIDMSLDGGLGGIDPLFKNKTVIADTLIYGRVSGVKHANGRDWWVVVHRSDSDLYHSLLVTPDSIYGPYSQNIGRPHHFEQFTQQCTFSPSGEKYVMELSVDTVTLHNVIELLDFDRCTGIFTNPRQIDVPDTSLLAPGCSFSPNSRFLYVSNQLNIYQYDTWDSNINSSVITVAQWDSFMSPLKTKFYSHQLAPDNKIYISTSEGTNVLHYINNPDLHGTACDVIQNSFFLPSYNNFCMPNAPNYVLGPVIGSLCDTLYNSIVESLLIDNTIVAFPNPASDQITFQFTSIGVDQELQILDIIGRVLISESVPNYTLSTKIDLTKLSPGSYIAFLSGGFSLRRKCKFTVVH